MKIKIKNTQTEELDVIPLAQKKRTSKKDTSYFHKESKTYSTNIHYLLYFLGFVTVCIIAAIIFRTIVTIKNSTFSTQSYSVLVSSDSPFLISVDTNMKKLSILKIDTKHKNRFKTSLELRVPLDGQFSLKKGAMHIDDFPSVNHLWSIIIKPWKYTYDGMTVIDAFKLIHYALGIQKDEITSYVVSVADDGSLKGIENADLYDSFKDPVIINEQQSIEVINGTNKEGLAGQVSQLLKNSGGNIVSIGSEENIKNSTITANKNSHTLTRISRILSITPTIDPNFVSISDIKIELGQDFVKRLK